MSEHHDEAMHEDIPVMEDLDSDSNGVLTWRSTALVEELLFYEQRKHVIMRCVLECHLFEPTSEE